MNNEYLNALIKQSAFTQDDIAELSGICPQTWYWRKRNNRFLISDLLAVAELLNLSDEEILRLLNRGGDDNER